MCFLPNKENRKNGHCRGSFSLTIEKGWRINLPKRLRTVLNKNISKEFGIYPYPFAKAEQNVMLFCPECYYHALEQTAEEHIPQYPDLRNKLERLMANIYSLMVTSKNRITIPKEIRQKYKIKEDSTLHFNGRFCWYLISVE